MICNNCKNNIEDNSKFCNICGASTSQDNSTQPTNTTYTAPPVNTNFNTQQTQPINNTTQKPPTIMVPYLVFSILTFLFCSGGQILSIVAIVFAGRISTFENRGDLEGARKSAKISLILSIISVVISVIIFIVFLFYMPYIISYLVEISPELAELIRDYFPEINVNIA